MNKQHKKHNENQYIFPFSDLLTKHKLPAALFTVLSSKQQAASLAQLPGESLVLVHRHMASISDSQALQLNGLNCSQAGEQTQTTQLMHVNLFVFTVFRTSLHQSQCSDHRLAKTHQDIFAWAAAGASSATEVSTSCMALSELCSQQLPHTTLKSLDIPLPSSPEDAGVPAKLKRKYGLTTCLVAKNENAEEKAALNEIY